eukprot:TRINITY_DN104237_c0_g1_i1.p2 TRINITY_DN104237_c0_g1~~TRINITY_DN104237_c0_g1_i1.p2  ORF type:complete len:215 (+),score=38.89 TRINITY_DN104237_c0_g1_i1:55-699(+)
MAEISVQSLSHANTFGRTQLGHQASSSSDTVASQTADSDKEACMTVLPPLSSSGKVHVPASLEFQRALPTLLLANRPAVSVDPQDETLSSKKERFLHEMANRPRCSPLQRPMTERRHRTEDFGAVTMDQTSTGLWSRRKAQLKVMATEHSSLKIDAVKVPGLDDMPPSPKRRSPKKVSISEAIEDDACGDRDDVPTLGGEKTKRSNFRRFMTGL